MSKNSERPSMSTIWPEGERRIAAVTLFVEDLEAARKFYGEVFDLPVHFSDDNSAVFAFGNTLINLLQADAAPELIEPGKVAGPRQALAFSSRSLSRTSTSPASSWLAAV